MTYRHKSLVISNLKNVNVYGHSLLLTPLKSLLCFMSPKRLSIIKTIRSNNQLINAFTHKMDIKSKNKAKKNSVALRYKWIVKNVWRLSKKDQKRLSFSLQRNADGKHRWQSRDQRGVTDNDSVPFMTAGYFHVSWSMHRPSRTWPAWLP